MRQKPHAKAGNKFVLDKHTLNTLVAIAAILTIVLVTTSMVSNPSSQRINEQENIESSTNTQASNLGGFAALSAQDFSDPVLSQRFAPAWDVFHNNVVILSSNPETVTSQVDKVTIQISHPASNSLQLTYDEFYIFHAQTKTWKKYTIGNGKLSAYRNFRDGPTSVVIPAQDLGVGDNYVAAYFCTSTVGSVPACGCSGTSSNNCGKWNIQRITATSIYSPVNDTTPPSASITSPQSGSSFNGITPEISFTATDNLDTSISFQFYVNNVADQLALGSAQNGSITKVNLTALPSATHSIYVRVQDDGGNSYNSSPIQLTINFADNIPPTAPANLVVEGVTSDSVALNWTASTDSGGSGVQLYKIYRDDVLVANVTQPTTKYTDDNLTAGTTYDYYVSALDNANRESTNSNTVSATTSAATPTDTTPPTSTITSPASGTKTSDTTPDVTFVLTDNAAASMNYIVYRNSTSVKNGIATNGTPTPETLPSVIDGTYAIRVQATDSAGNAVNSSPVIITIDATAPTINLPTASSITYNSAILQLTTDENSTCKFNQNADATYSAMSGTMSSTDKRTHSTTVSNLQAGQTYTYYFRCLDTTGNVGPTSGTVSKAFTTLNQVACSQASHLGIACFPGATPTSPFSCSGPSPGVCAWTCGATNSLGQACLAGATILSGYDCQGTGSTCRLTPVAPPTPTGLTATANSNSQITVSWTAASGATSYTVYRASSIGGPFTSMQTGITTTSFANSGLSGSSTYYYKVTALNGALESPQQSTPASATTSANPDTTPPVISLLTLSPSSGVAKPGDTIVLAITADAAGYTNTSVLINGRAGVNFRAGLTSGQYLADYTVLASEAYRAPGTIGASVVLRDTAGNMNSAYTTVQTNTLAIDATPPVQSNTSTNGITTTGATMYITTSEVASCRYGTTSSQSYSAMTNTFSTTNVRYHSTAVSGLAPNTAYTYYVRCIDGVGNEQTTPSSITFTTAVPTRVTSVNSINNAAYTVGATVPITITFSQAVTVNGIPTLTLETGTTDRLATYASGSGTNVLTFSYAVQAGDTSSDLDYTSTSALQLAGGSIISSVGAANIALSSPGASGSLAANADIVIDTTAPTLSVSPAAGTTVSSGTYIIATVSSDVTSVDFTIDSDSVQDTSAPFQVYWDPSIPSLTTFAIGGGGGGGGTPTKHFVSIVATDAAGNIATTSFFYWYKGLA